MANASHTTRAERREHKKRKRMPVTGKHVFTLKRLAARSARPAKAKKRR